MSWIKSKIAIAKNYLFIAFDNLKFKVLALILIMEVLFFFLLKNGYNELEISSIQSNILTVSGIFSGIVIAYIFSKIFQIKSEKESRKPKIDKLSLKLTNFRKLLYYVMNSNEFWMRRNDITKFEEQYEGVDFDELHNQVGQSKNSSKFWLDERKLSRTTIDLYLSMKAIIDDPNRAPYWIFDRSARFDYSLQQIRKYYKPSNQIWYYLQGRYKKHTQGLINDELLNRRDVYQIREHASMIDPKYKNQDVDKDLIAGIGNEFYEILLPQLLELTELNYSGMPKGIKQMLLSIILILLFGVTVPLFFSIFPFDPLINSYIIKVSGSVIILLFVNFVFDFISIINSELVIRD